ncbi:MAG: class I SAM-dependent methyltransferase [Terracidiphilus sp.]|jgi:hypothetical protein
MISITRKYREKLKSVLHGFFVLAQRCGWDILPRYFYSSIPAIHELRQKDDWKRASSLMGVNGTDLYKQLAFLRSCCTPSLQERIKQSSIHNYACGENDHSGGFGPIEAEVLFCYISTKRPRKIVQIGCGVSTAVILLAAKEANYEPEIICIEPYPSNYLMRAAQEKLIELVSKPAQDVDLEVLTGIGEGDLFFVDSTHSVRPGSEVNRIILEVLPRLPTGSTVHFHDIFFPYDYQPSLMTNLFFHGESTLLHAFLINNQRYSIAVSLCMLHHGCPGELQSILGNYTPALTDHGLWKTKGEGHLPSSAYLIVS